MSLEGAVVLANVAFLVLGGLTLIAGIVVLMLGRAMDRAKDREIEHLRLEAATASATAATQLATVESRLLNWISSHNPSPGGAEINARLAPPSLKPADALPPSRRDSPVAPPPIKPVEVLSLEPDTATPDRAAMATQRRLTASQRQKMEAILRLAPSMIMITTDGHAEPERFADELQSAFVEAGWHVDRAVYASLTRPLAPLSANLKPTPIDVAVRGAFAASGLTLAARDSPDSNSDREIFVGSTAPPK